jgi:hypothetical protein
MRKVTLTQIARECVCDVATVSRVNAEQSDNTEVQATIARYLGVPVVFAFPRSKHRPSPEAPNAA